jgi:hypothetical protein
MVICTSRVLVALILFLALTALQTKEKMPRIDLKNYKLINAFVYTVVKNLLIYECREWRK